MCIPGNDQMIFQPITKKYWQNLVLCKQTILEKGIAAADEYASIDSRITNSWINCHHAGLNPEDKLQIAGSHKQGTILRAAVDNLLIDAATSVFNKINRYPIDNYRFYLELVSKDNVRLYASGLERNLLYDYNPIPNEAALGTNCHGLVREYHCPVQLAGPENYLKIYYNYLVCGAPIFDDSGTYLGGVFLNKKLTDQEWTDMTQTAQISNLYFVCSVATAVERCWLVKKYSKHYEAERDYQQYMLELFQNFASDAIITLNHNGFIIDINHQAGYILGIDEPYGENLPKQPFADLLKTTKNLTVLLQGHLPANFTGWLITRQGETFCSFDYIPLTKVDPNHRAGAVLRIVTKEKTQFKTTQADGLTTKFGFDNIMGESAIIKKTIETAKYLAASGENILLIGESGTGKELFAQALHNSYNAAGPFIALNCAAFPRSLIESELFGYEQGTFTGAEKNGRAGKIERADGGTLFLDEIGDMPFDVQAIFLRVLQDKQVVRIGGVKYRPVNFRVIAATNQDLKQLIVEKKFRQDLYFRLAVLTLNIPPLRERTDDIMLLSHYFIERYCHKHNVPVPEFTPQARKLFCDNLWPGNVRELENAIIYSVNMSRGKAIDINHVSEDVHKGTNGFKGTFSDHCTFVATDIGCNEVPSMEEIEALYVKRALAATNNNVTKAAAMLKISKATLYRHMKKL